MDYSLEEASAYIGKRFIVSLRHVAPDTEDKYTGFWGVIDSAHDNGLLLAIEGGLDEKFWMFPPVLDFKPAEHKYYQWNDSDVIEHVDFEAYFTVAAEAEHLKDRN